MLPLYIQTLLRKPALVAQQIETYGQIAFEELSVESTRLRRWMFKTLAAAMLAAVGVFLAGTALLLWAVEHNRVALLWIVPSAFLLSAWLLRVSAGPPQGPRFPVLRGQLAEDRVMFEVDPASRSRRS